MGLEVFGSLQLIEERAPNGDLPFGAAFSNAFTVGGRFVGCAAADFGADRVEVGPESNREPGERGGAERGRLAFGGDLDRAAEQVG